MAPKRTTFDGHPELDLGLPKRDLEWPEGHQLRPGLLPAGRLPGFTTSVLAQVNDTDYRVAARLAEYTGVGAVLTLRGGGPLWIRAQGPTWEMRRRTKSLLVDANEYSGKNRKTADAGLDAAWVDQQHQFLRLGWALTNSGYAPTLGHVFKLLEDGSKMPGQSITALPVPWRVFRDHAPAIADKAREQGHPIALVLEHRGDPFDEADVTRAVVHVIQHAGNPVLLLRSDVSALGVISHGAAAGAVGAAGLRHLYPNLDGDGWRPPVAFVIPKLLGYYLQTRFTKAFLRDPGHRAWACDCWFCGGRSLDWIANEHPKLIERAVMSHSVAALARVAERLAEHPDPAAGWTAMCSAAAQLHAEIANPSGSPWTAKPALTHWQALTPALT